MKATGIVRRIDDLGRVVIPKEIRRTLRIREGDPLEIYTDTDGGVIFKKYSPVGELSPFATTYSDVLAHISNFPVVICDRDHVVAVAGLSKREYLERRITSSVEDLMEARQNYTFKPANDSNPITPIEGMDKKAVVISPIIVAGDVTGAVIMLQNENNTIPGDTETKLVQTAAIFLGKQME